MKLEKFCGECGCKYLVKPSHFERSKFCSKACLKRHGSIDKICACCGVVFNIPKRRSDEIKFCSAQCRIAVQRKILECKWCKKPFSCKSHRERVFCSRECFHAADKGSEHLGNQSDEKYYKDCIICGKNFRVTKTRKDTAKYCSIACKVKCPDLKYRFSIAQREERSHRWTGGLYKTGQGYIRHKVQIFGVQTVSFGHREVVLTAMLKECPEHPFIVKDDSGIIKLSSNIEVHHIDRVRSNNELSNLLAVTKWAHSQIHHHNRKPEPWECWPRNPTIW